MEKTQIDLQGARILVVDDTAANLDVLCELLEPEGYKISMAPSGEVALRIAGRVMPDLILLDVMMPGIDGFEVCRRLKRDGAMREIPVVLFNGMLETQMEHTRAPAQLFDRLNRSIHRIMDSRTFVCFAMAQVDPETRCMRLTNAGCPYPFHYRAAGGEVVELQMAEAYPLGVKPDSDYRSQDVQLAPGDRVVFFSDGIVEAENARGEVFGFERAAEAIRSGCAQGLPAQDLLERIVAAVDAFTGGATATDDRTCVVLGVKARD